MSDISDASSASSDSFVTALVFNLIIAGAEIAAFTLLRPYFKSVYEPRTYVPSKSKRSSPLTSSMFLWPLAVWKLDYRDIRRANGMDAYFYVRFLRLMIKIFVPIWLISWIVLLPTTSVNTGKDNRSGLDRLSFGNVANDDQIRYVAHLLMAYLFTGWIFYNIKHDMAHFAITRQKHLIEPEHARSVQANTLLITGVPAKFLDRKMIVDLFKDLPGGVKQVWINRDLKELPDIYDRRLTACNKLEKAETALIKTATKLRAKQTKSKKSSDIDHDVEADASLAAKLVPRNQRPMHSLSMIPFKGPKVDTIDYCREEIRVCNELLEQGRSVIARDVEGAPKEEDENGFAVQDSDEQKKQAEEEQKQREELAAKHGINLGPSAKDKALSKIPGIGGAEKKSYPPLNSVFVQFNRQIGAHLAMQSLTHHEPYRMTGKYLEVAPEDVIWSNLNLNPYEQKVRIAISYALTAGLIIFWAIPVAFVGVVSNISALCVKYSWLAWVCKAPTIVTSIITGILPPVLLAVLMMLLPIVLRLFARFEGIPTKTGLELSLMTRYFIFQVIHSFLIVTLASGLIAALPELASNPASIPSLLATKLPQASNFFLTYIILQGLAGTASGFLQVAPLVIYYIKLFILGTTPRSVHGIKYNLRSVAWGTLFPNTTLITTIAIAYMIISPVINGLAVATFFLFYQLYKYLFLNVYGIPPANDTGGLFFPKAIQHLFVGLYVQQICLAALFFLARDQNGSASAIPQGALMVVLIIITIGFNIVIKNSYGPLLHALPLSLADKTWGASQRDQELSPNPSSYPEDHASVQMSDRRNSPRIAEPQRMSHDVDSEYRGLTGKGTVSSMRGGDDSPRRNSGIKSEEDYGFVHPAASRPQRTVWLPHDTLGLGAEEIKGCRESGVDASLDNAVMNEKGKVDVKGSPPDEIDEE